MDDIIKAILHLNEEIKKIKEQIELLKRKPEVNYKTDWMDGPDVRQFFHISLRSLRTLRESGKIACTRLLKKYYYKVSDIKKLLSDNHFQYHKTNHHD